MRSGGGGDGKTYTGFMPVTRDLTRTCLGPGTGMGMVVTMVYGSLGAVTWSPVWVAIFMG
jgi:hypothetical protein